MIFEGKINKIPEFYTIFARKIFFLIFFVGGAGTTPLAPVCYVYGPYTPRRYGPVRYAARMVARTAEA